MNSNKIIALVEDPQIRDDIPDFSAGDTVVVSMRVTDQRTGRERIQNFEGVVLCRKGTGVHESCIVRKISQGVGVEFTFQLQSKSIESIQVTRRGKVKQGRIYYLRSRRGRAARIKQKL